MTPVATPQHGMHGLAPHLVCAGAADAIDFYRRAFDAEEMMRLPTPDGKIMHAAIKVNGCMVMLVDEMPEVGGGLGPAALHGTPVTLHLTVTDADAVAAQAIAAGAREVMAVADQFWGDRYGVVEDPFGHRWAIATPSGKAMNQEELAASLREATAVQGAQQ